MVETSITVPGTTYGVYYGIVPGANCNTGAPRTNFPGGREFVIAVSRILLYRLL